MPGTIPTIQPAEKPLSSRQLRKLKATMKLVTDGEHRGDARRFGLYRVIQLLPFGDSLRAKLLHDVGKQEELTTQAMAANLLNGLYPTQFNFPPLFD